MSNKFNFEFNLSHQSISNLAKNIKLYKKELKNAQKDILQKLAEYTQERVKYYISYSVGLGTYPTTHELENSILISSIINDMVSVYTNNAYAKFVEFGTGVIGKNNKQYTPKSSDFNWSYDKNEKGEYGWVYHASDGNFYWTSGMEGHNFMYNAYLDLKENYLSIVNNVLREKGLI